MIGCSGGDTAIESSTISSLTGSRVTSPSNTDTNDASSGSESTLSADAAEAILDAALSNAALLGRLGSSVEWLLSQYRRPHSQPVGGEFRENFVSSLGSETTRMSLTTTPL